MDVCICMCIYVLVCGIGYILMFAINIYTNTIILMQDYYIRESKWRGVGGVVGDGDKWLIGSKFLYAYILG